MYWFGYRCCRTVYYELQSTFSITLVILKCSVKQFNLLVNFGMDQSLPSLALPALDKHNRALVVLPCAQYVVDHAKHGNTDEHDGRPVEELESRGRAVGPKAPEKGVHGVEDTTDVDGHAPFAEGPGAHRESLGVRDTAPEDGTDGEDVGDHKRNNVERDDYT